MRVGIIGAGAAGLCAAQVLSCIKDRNVSITVFEQTGNVGGTWVYTERTLLDEFGLPVHSSMYKNLRTNLPKETMEFQSFPFKNKKSFLSRCEVLQYLNEFVDHFELSRYIKFCHYVINVKPKNQEWEITVKNLETNKLDVLYFDAVMVCNGHYSEPRLPQLPGMDLFKKLQMHSHHYRLPEQFAGENVVVLGAGPSGIDISFDIAPFCKNVYFSHHHPPLIKAGFPENVIHKPDILKITENSVEFFDGTSAIVDVILYCTGYNYTFPFLSKECGVTVDDNFVKPLYKHLININHPSMCFIGIPWQTLIFPMFELQVHCFLNVLFNKVELPSIEEMFSNLEAEINKNEQNGHTRRYFHCLGKNVRSYLVDIATSFNAKPIKEVVHKIYDSAAERRKECLKGYREDIYEVINSSSYVLHKNKNM